MFRTLTEDIFVAPQIDVADVATAQQLGVSLIINNRPERETDDQTPGADIEAAARAAGLDYVAIPVAPGGFTPAQVEAMEAALAGAQGKVLAYCRSGNRSTNLWALAKARAGGDPNALAATAADAGYDLSGIIPLMQRLRDGG